MILFPVILTGNLFAYDGWSVGKIETIRIQGNRVLITQENASNPGNCPNTDYLFLPQSESVFHKNMYAALLAANVSQKRVHLALSSCYTGYPAISEVWLVGQ